MEEEIKDLAEKIEEMKRIYLVNKGKAEQLAQRKEQKEEALAKLREQKEILEQVRILLQQTSEFAREQARQQVEWLVTSALQAIFGPELEFKIELNEARGRPEAEFYVVSQYGGVEVKVKPQDARGGGIIDVISLALRFAIIHLFQPPIGGPIILDEPAKHVSEEYIANVAQFLKDISIYFQRQVIMVTHNNYLSEMGDTSYRVELKDGKSQVILLKKAW